MAGHGQVVPFPAPRVRSPICRPKTSRRRMLVGQRHRCAELAPLPFLTNATTRPSYSASAEEMRATNDYDLPHHRRHACFYPVPGAHSGHRPRYPRCPKLAPDLGTGSYGRLPAASFTSPPRRCRGMTSVADTPLGSYLSGAAPAYFGCRTAEPYQWQASNASSTSSRSLPISWPRRATARPTRYFTELKCRLSSSAAIL